MSILIKGIEMPSSCSDCPMCYDMMECTASALRFWRNRQEREEFDFCTERHPDCPLVPVPPHGRLIDADAVQDEWYRLNFDRKITDGTLAYWNMQLSKAPTIIEAEEGE